MTDPQTTMAKVRELMMEQKERRGHIKYNVAVPEMEERIVYLCELGNNYPEIAASYLQMHSDLLEAKEALVKERKEWAKLSEGYAPDEKGKNVIKEFGIKKFAQLRISEIEKNLKKLSHYTPYNPL